MQYHESEPAVSTNETLLESNQPLLDGRKTIELSVVSVLASDVYIFDRTGLR